MLGRGFIDRYYELSREKNSILCVGLDPVTASIRSRYIIPPKLMELHGPSGGIKKFCIDIIESVSPYTPVIKPNAQFTFYPFSLDEMKEVVEAIHEGNCLALLDAKLSDIGSTNSVGLHWIDRAGFDAVTFSSFPGFENGSDAVYNWAAKRDKGIFALCRMSNPGTHDYQSLKVNGEPLYLRLARDAYEKGSNGFVVGCTATSELGEVRAVIGDRRLILAPGLGPQGGDPALAIKLGANSDGEGLIISSSRSIDYAYENLGWKWEGFADAAAAQAERKQKELNILMRRAIT